MFWEDLVQGGDLIDAGGTSLNQAFAERNRYFCIVRENLAYDQSAPTDVRGAHFESLFLKSEATGYLSQLCPASNGNLAQEKNTWIDQLPTFSTVSSPTNGIDTGQPRAVIQAIRNARPIGVEYQSLFWPPSKTSERSAISVRRLRSAGFGRYDLSADPALMRSLGRLSGPTTCPVSRPPRGVALPTGFATQCAWRHGGEADKT